MRCGCEYRRTHICHRNMEGGGYPRYLARKCPYYRVIIERHYGERCPDWQVRGRSRHRRGWWYFSCWSCWIETVFCAVAIGQRKALTSNSTGTRNSGVEEGINAHSPPSIPVSLFISTLHYYPKNSGISKITPQKALTHP